MTDLPTLRHQTARALAREDAHNAGYDHGFTGEYGGDAETDGFVDAVLGPLFPLLDRAASYRAAWHSARRRARVLSDELTRRAPLLDDLSLLRMADEAQQPEPWPSESQWRVEIYDPLAGEWMPAGSLTTKPEAERRLALANERAPRWRDDGTDVRRRIVRTTITYTVEAETQQPEEADACGPGPDACDAEAGEPCAKHERQQAHAEGEHAFCGTDCSADKEAGQ
ncbi:hypothetical protein [Streptomyces xanthochromogenes]